MVGLGPTIHEFRGHHHVSTSKLVDGRAKHDHDECECDLAYKLYRHPGLEPGSIAQPLVRRMNGSRLKAGMTGGEAAMLRV